MNNVRRLSIITVVAMSIGVVEARDTKIMISIEEAMSTPDALARLDERIKYYFGAQEHGEIERAHGTFTSNRKTNAFNKSDRDACLWVFLSAMLSFQERVRAEGGNAVINLRSYYRRNLVNSETQFECGAGNLMAGVTFVGEVVTLSE
jgi:hypothetical protein